VGQVTNDNLSARGEVRDARQSARAGVGAFGAKRTGTYPLGTGLGPGRAIGAFTISFRNGSLGRSYRFTDGTLEITLVDDRRLRGPFDGTLAAEDGTTLTVTGGSFDVPAVTFNVGAVTFDGFDGSESVQRQRAAIATE
jgi:hypothetical protein